MPTFQEVIRRQVQESVASLVAVADRDNFPGWRSISQKYLNTPSDTELEKGRDFAFQLWLRNPLAYSLVEILVSFVCGGGIIYQAPTPRLQKLVDAFWKNERNNLDQTMEMKLRGLSIYGELCLPAFVTAAGEVLLGYVPSRQIKTILPDSINPSIPDKVVLLPRDSDVSVVDDNKLETLSIIRQDFDPLSPTYGKLKGDCFYFSINRTPDMVRGVSDLFSIADWIDIHDQVLFARAERVSFMNTWFRDVLIEGASQEEIDKFIVKEKSQPNRSGRDFVHNERTKAELMSPNLNASDAVDDAAMIRDHVLTAPGYPDHWFPSQAARSRSSAADMAEPTYRRIESRQKYWRECLSYMTRFAIERHFDTYPKQPRGVNYDVKINMPNISKRDIQRAGGVFGYIAGFMEKAQVNKWLKPEEIRALTLTLAAELGFTVGEAFIGETTAV